MAKILPYSNPFSSAIFKFSLFRALPGRRYVVALLRKRTVNEYSKQRKQHGFLTQTSLFLYGPKPRLNRVRSATIVPPNPTSAEIMSNIPSNIQRKTDSSQISSLQGFQ
ncbi:hypothetical protein ACU8KH_04472 [Lachancea thermotolerans]